MKKIKITLALMIILNLAAPILTSAQTQLLNQPKNFDEAKQIGEKALEAGQKEAPGVIEKIWQNEVLPVWQKMFNWVKTRFGENKLGFYLNNFWQKAKEILNSEVEQRKPVIEENFQKEKQQLKEEVPEVGKSLWEKFKELIK